MHWPRLVAHPSPGARGREAPETIRDKRRPAMHLASAAPHISTVTTADDGWYRAITSFARDTAWLHGALAFYTVAGIGLLILMAAYAWWTARARADRRAMAAVVWVALGTAVSVGCGLGLKQLFRENRPCQAMHVVT